MNYHVEVLQEKFCRVDFGRKRARTDGCLCVVQSWVWVRDVLHVGDNKKGAQKSVRNGSCGVHEGSVSLTSRRHRIGAARMSSTPTHVLCTVRANV